MSSVCVLTPIVVASWPTIAASIAGAASALGFTVVGLNSDDAPRTRGADSVETEVPNSEVIAETLSRGEKLRIVRDGVTIEFGVDDRGKVSVCASGKGHTKGQLKQIGQDVAGRVVQQFAYHKLVNELKTRGYDIAEESVTKDHSIQIKVRAGR